MHQGFLQSLFSLSLCARRQVLVLLCGVQVCPKSLNPGLSIARMKGLSVKVADLDKKLEDKAAIELAVRKLLHQMPPVARV